MLMHDTTLERTTSCTGLVSAMTLADLQANCFLKNARDGQVTDDRVPTYEQVAEYANSVRKPIAPEIKLPNSDLSDAELADFVQTTQDSGEATRTYVQSFEGSTVFPRLHALAPDLATIFLSSYNTDPRVITAAGSGIASPEYHSVNATWLARYHAAGLKVWTWTVDDAPSIQRMWTLGANGIFSNYPTVARALLR